MKVGELIQQLEQYRASEYGSEDHIVFIDTSFDTGLMCLMGDAVCKLVDLPSYEDVFESKI